MKCFLLSRASEVLAISGTGKVKLKFCKEVTLSQFVRLDIKVAASNYSTSLFKALTLVSTLTISVLKVLMPEFAMPTESLNGIKVPAGNSYIVYLRPIYCNLQSVVRAIEVGSTMSNSPRVKISTSEVAVKSIPLGNAISIIGETAKSGRGITMG